MEIFNRVLQPRSLIVVGYEANQRVKHGVPPVEKCGPSGSSVGRRIATAIPWETVQKKAGKRAAAKAKAQEEAAEDGAGAGMKRARIYVEDIDAE